MFTANNILANGRKKFIAFSELIINKLGGTDLDSWILLYAVGLIAP